MTSYNRLWLATAMLGAICLLGACGNTTDALGPLHNPGSDNSPSAVNPAIAIPPAESFVDLSAATDSLESRWVKNCYQTLPTLSSPSSVYQNASLAVWAQQIYDRVNQTRGGAPRLVRLPHLDALAQAQARDMALRNYFGHANPEGMRSVGRMLAINAPTFNILGENAAKGQETVDEVISQWIASPGHYQHMINGAYQYTGVGVYYDRMDSAMPVHVVQVFAELYEDPLTYTEWVEPGPASAGGSK